MLEEMTAEKCQMTAEESLQILKYRLFVLLLVLAILAPTIGTLAQKGKRSGSHPSGPRETISELERQTVEQAIGLVCSDRVQDARGSMPIDDMQKRPSLPLQAPDVARGDRKSTRLNSSHLVISY